MKKSLAALILSTFMFVLAVQPGHAYETTAKQAFTLDGKTAIFLIEFAFGHENHEIHMPLSARAGNAETPTSLSYVIYDDEGEAAKGLTTGIVLSSAPYRKGMYVTPRGHKIPFTLLVAYTPSEDENQNAFRAEVTHLPFSFDGIQQLKLNPSELQYYTTEFVSLEQ